MNEMMRLQVAFLNATPNGVDESRTVRVTGFNDADFERADAFGRSVSLSVSFTDDAVTPQTFVWCTPEDADAFTVDCTAEVADAFRGETLFQELWDIVARGTFTAA